MNGLMTYAIRLLGPALLIAAAAPAEAAPGGRLATLPLGEYVCETPGGAWGPAGILMPEAGFRIETNSTYRAADGHRGTYLLTGRLLAMTSGPHQGEHYFRQSRGFLRLLDASGRMTRLRCVLRLANNR